MPRLAWIAIFVVVLFALVCLWGYESFMHSRLDFPIAFVERTIEARTPTQLTGMSSLSSDYVSAGGVSKVWNDSSPEERVRLSQTWGRALIIAADLRRVSSNHQIFSESVSLRDLTIDTRLDGWGRPFCMTRVGGKIAIVSAGLSRDKEPSCAGIVTESVRIDRLQSKKLYILPTGYLILFVDASSERD